MSARLLIRVVAATHSHLIGIEWLRASARVGIVLLLSLFLLIGMYAIDALRTRRQPPPPFRVSAERYVLIGVVSAVVGTILALVPSPWNWVAVAPFAVAFVIALRRVGQSEVERSEMVRK